jgi:hypothetical protein
MANTTLTSLTAQLGCTWMVQLHIRLSLAVGQLGGYILHVQLNITPPKTTCSTVSSGVSVIILAKAMLVMDGEYAPYRRTRVQLLQRSPHTVVDDKVSPCMFYEVLR